jgi:AraC-like DNA-binding protein
LPFQSPASKVVAFSQEKVTYLDIPCKPPTFAIPLNVDPSFVQHRQQMEFGAGVLLHLYRFLTNRQVTPASVHFVHSRQHGLREVSRYFGCRVSYLQNRSQIVLKASDMANPNRHLGLPAVEGPDGLLRGRPPEHGTRQAGLLQKVEQRIIDLLPKGAARAKVIATDLGMSERTLTRRLAALGTTFNETLDRMRNDLALKYMRETEPQPCPGRLPARLRQSDSFQSRVQALDRRAAKRAK